MRIRKNLSELSSSELENLIEAMKKLKDSGDWDNFVDAHVSHFSHVHFTYQQFLPWHRMFILKFEDKLRTFDSSVTLPYWRWIGMRKIPDGFEGRLFGWMDVTRALFHNGDNLPTASDVSKVMEQVTLEKFSDDLEAIHAEVHVWVGGTMSTAKSAKDPLFWFHHAYCDKLWERWTLKPGVHRAFEPWNLHDPYESTSVTDVWSGVKLGYQYTDMTYYT